MKIALASDVHLEFGHLEIENTDNADVLVLSGDICVAKNFGPKIMIDFFRMPVINLKM
jgi:predicted phosphodiesterase